MPGGESDPSAARGGVQVGGALAHQIGQPEQPLRARWGGGGFGGQRIVFRAGRQLVAEPLQAQPRALGHTHHVPLVAHRMAEGVDAAGRIVGHVFHVGENYAGGAQRTRNDAGFHDAIAHRAGSLVAAAYHHGRALGETCGRGRCARDAAGDVARFMAGGQDGAVQAQRVQHVARPAPRHYIEQRSAGCVRDVAGILAGELEAQIVLGQQQVADAFECARLVIAHP